MPKNTLKLQRQVDVLMFRRCYFSLCERLLVGLDGLAGACFFQ